MHTANAPGGSARTYLIHMFGSGLEGDDRFVVERFRSHADGDIRPIQAGEPATRGRRKIKHMIVPLKAVKEMRPAPDEIIICTGLRTMGGWQLWGYRLASRAMLLSRPSPRHRATRPFGSRCFGCSLYSLIDKAPHRKIPPPGGPETAHQGGMLHTAGTLPGSATSAITLNPCFVS